MRKFTGPVIAIGLATVGLIGGVSLATGDTTPDPQFKHVERQVTDQSVDASAPSTTAAFSTFAKPAADATVSPEDQVNLRNAFGGAATAPQGAIAHADFSKARSAPIAGSSSRAYMVPSGAKMCLILPDPGDGFASTCQTPSDIAAGHGVLFLTPRHGSSDQTAWVAVMQPDGAADPLLASTDGSNVRVKTIGNIAAVKAAAGDQLHIAGDTLYLN